MPFISGEGCISLAKAFEWEALTGDCPEGACRIIQRKKAAMPEAAELQVFAVPVGWQRRKEINCLASFGICDKATGHLAEGR